jgi:hypothetical protein
MDMGARLRSGDPPARPIGQRDAAVQRKGQLERDMRAAEARAGQIAGEAGGGRRMVDKQGVDTRRA